MPSATLDDIALRSTNPVMRAMDLICIVMLQLLTVMVLAAERDPDKYRNHPAFGSCTILARLDAGETFDLPPLLLATIKIVARQLRAALLIGAYRLEPASCSNPDEAQHPAARTNAKRRRAATRRARPAVATHALTTHQTRKLAGQGARPGHSKEPVLPSGSIHA